MQAISQNTFMGGFLCPGCFVCKILSCCYFNARLRGLRVVMVRRKISVALISLLLYLPPVKFIGQQNKQTMENEIAGWPLFWGGFVVVAGALVVMLDWLGGGL